MIEVPGKRGRLIGEQESIKVNRISFENAKKALCDEAGPVKTLKITHGH